MFKSSQQIDLDGIPVTFYKSKKARSINITIKPFKGVRVAVPWYATYKQAISFVSQRQGWIKKHSLKMQHVENQKTIFGWDTKFTTKHHSLKITKTTSGTISSKVANAEIRIFIPENISLESEEVQDFIKKTIELAWRKEAKEYLPNRVKELADKYGLNFKKVKINNAKTRWGSCSHDNNINLTLNLMRLPDRLIDYVILHELAHTKVKNHGPEFWHLLNQLVGDAKKMDKELKHYNLRVI